MNTLRSQDVAIAAALARVSETSFDAQAQRTSPDAFLSDAALPDRAVLYSPETTGFIIVHAVSDVSEIHSIAVAPDARGDGVGRALLDAALDWSRKRGAKDVFLEVAEDSRAAITLYDRAGFERVGRRAGYYRRAGCGRVDALVLRRRL